MLSATGRGPDSHVQFPAVAKADANSPLVGKDPDAGQDRRQEEKRATEDETVGWRQGLNGRELGQTPGDSEGQGGLAWCSPWGSRRVGHDLATTTKARRRYVLLKATQLSCGRAVTRTQVFWHLDQFSFYLSKYLLSAYYVPGTVLGAGETAGKGK